MSENKIKIALICFDNPFLKPAEGGKKGMLTRIQSLALTEEYDVDVYLHNKRTEGFADNYKGFDKAMTFYQYSMNKTSVGSVLSPYPICVNKRYVSECVAELQKHEYERIIYDYITENGSWDIPTKVRNAAYKAYKAARPDTNKGSVQKHAPKPSDARNI